MILFSYRAFREDEPNFGPTSLFWNVTAARLAFIIVFEHLIYFIIYLMQWLVPDVPKSIKNQIDHERYIDQRERWASKLTEDHLQDAAIASEALTKILTLPNGNTKASTKEISTDSNRRRSRKVRIGTESFSEN